MKSSPSIELARRAATSLVAHEAIAERAAQDAKWGEQNHPVVYAAPDGARYSLASYGLWLPVVVLQERCEARARRGTIAWGDILVEELAEVLDAGARGDVAGARRELVQLAAVAIQAIESIDRAGGR